MDPVHIIAVEIKKIEHSWVAALDLLAEEANSPAAASTVSAHRVPLHGYTARLGIIEIESVIVNAEAGALYRKPLACSVPFVAN
jgi:hypothetical protein